MSFRMDVTRVLATSLLALAAANAAVAQTAERHSPATVATLEPAPGTAATDRGPGQPEVKGDPPAVAAPVSVEPIAPVATPVPAATPSPTAPGVAAEPGPSAPVVASPATPPTDPIVSAVLERLKKPISGLEQADMTALTAFYALRSAPAFVANGAFTPAAEAIAAELGRSDDWGLPAKLYAASRPASADTGAMADAEVGLASSALKYARDVSGGRVLPSSLSRYNDLRGQPADPSQVLAALASSPKPDAVLLDLHPQHAQYKLLQQALVKLRLGAAPAPEPAPAKSDPVPATGPSLKLGVSHPDVVLIRGRLGIQADVASDKYDEAVEDAVETFQADNGIKATGVVNAATRKALAAGEARRKAADPAKDMERIAVNMERWRWMPRDLGRFHIMNNIPEFTTRVTKDGQVLHKERIIVGKTNTQTPEFSANMRFVIFHPEWGVPDSIKVKEIWPSLRRKSPDDLFGSTSDTRVLQRHNMRVAYNGKVVDASKIDWSTADPRQYSFIQGAGGANVLGVVKFRFPNRHDVYMHDTPERSLFQNATRAYSHGCMRVNNPRRLAELILAEDRGWTADRVGAAIAGKATQDITLERPFPVHNVYFTARVDEATGKLETFADLYGRDVKVTAAIAGKPVSLEPLETKEALSAEVRQQVGKRKQKDDSDPVASFLSGLFAN